MKRRDVLKSAVAGAAALAAPRVVQAEGARTINFTPHADLASLDPVWTTADITRNFSLAVYDTLYGYDAEFNVQPQMVEGAAVENDGRLWDLTLRDGLAFHDGTPVLARDCVATIQRFAKRYPYGEALMARTDELSAPSDKVIRFRLKRPFALVPNAPTPPFPEGFNARPAPFGVSFSGMACSEPRLIEIAYAFEQATRRRVAPPPVP